MTKKKNLEPNSRQNFEAVDGIVTYRYKQRAHRQTYRKTDVETD